MIEIGQVVVSAIEAYLRYWIVRFGQHLGRKTDSDTFYILYESAIGFFLEIPAE